MPPSVQRSWKIAHFRGISVMLIWVVVVVGFYYYLTTKSLTGRHFYAVGGNARTAELSGINTKKIYFLAYTSMAFLAGFSSLNSAILPEYLSCLFFQSVVEDHTNITERIKWGYDYA